MDFKPAVYRIEFRRDPLTGRPCRINIERAKRVKQARERGGADLLKVVEESKEKCFSTLHSGG